MTEHWKESDSSLILCAWVEGKVALAVVPMQLLSLAEIRV